MSNLFTVACVQNSAENDLNANLTLVAQQVRDCAAQGAQLICLAECFAFLEANDAAMLAGASRENDNPALEAMCGLAAELDVWLLAGSMMVRVGDARVNNRSYLIDPRGIAVASYNKLHLFDVDLPDGESYQESSAVAPGDDAVLAHTPWGLLGLTVCYDLRFAQLYRALAQAGAAFLTIPAAFTQTTGEAHWHTLVRARAIETGCFVFAPNQCGVRSFGRATYGHSLIVDPWGEILADGGELPGVVLAEIDPQRVSEVRGRVPALSHDRPFTVRAPAKLRDAG